MTSSLAGILTILEYVYNSTRINVVRIINVLLIVKNVYSTAKKLNELKDFEWRASSIAC